jgi:hypothetical protein
MADQGLTLAVRLSDLTLDEEGRVTIEDPEIAELLEAAKGPGSATRGNVTNNCRGGNCAAGCGVKQN